LLKETTGAFDGALTPRRTHYESDSQPTAQCCVMLLPHSGLLIQADCSVVFVIFILRLYRHTQHKSQKSLFTKKLKLLIPKH